LEYPAWEHEKRVKWLSTFAQISDPSNFSVDEEGQLITMEVMIDETVYLKWLKEFEPDQFEQAKKQRKHYQPQHW